MTDEPRRRDFVDLSPYLAHDATPAAARGATELGQPAFVRFRPSSPAPSVLDGPGYLVLSRGELAPGAEVAIGRMPAGIGGGVAEWTAGRIAEADGMAAPAVGGEPGWYVPAGAIACPRCGDQNWDESRRCITCTDGDDAYAEGAFAGGWSEAAAERARAALD